MEVNLKHWFSDVFGVQRYYVFIDGVKVWRYEVNLTIDPRSTAHGKYMFEHYENGEWKHESPYYETKVRLLNHIKEYHTQQIIKKQNGKTRNSS